MVTSMPTLVITPGVIRDESWCMTRRHTNGGQCLRWPTSSRNASSGVRRGPASLHRVSTNVELTKIIKGAIVIQHVL